MMMYMAVADIYSEDEDEWFIEALVHQINYQVLFRDSSQAQALAREYEQENSENRRYIRVASVNIPFRTEAYNDAK